MARPASIARDPFVLRHDEVARDYFRQSPASLTPAALLKRYPTFPRPRHDGLYLREAVEAWVRKSFGVDVEYRSIDVARALEIARHG